jgi:hypothetical protein
MENPSMRPQQTIFAEAGFETNYKPMRREQFLGEMDRVVPWKEFVRLRTRTKMAHGR